jgi:lysophospholipase L1-like esterase
MPAARLPRIRWFAVFLIWSLGQSLALAQSNLVVWCFGDSITNLYAPVLASLRPDWDVENYGLDHETSTDGLVRLQALLAEKPLPNVVVILEGANDIGFHLMGDPNYPLGGYGASVNVRAMAAAVRAAGAVPITALPVGTISPSVFPFARDFILAFRREYRTLGAQLRDQNPNVHFRLRYIDEFATVGFFIHQSDLGSMVLSRRVVVVVERLLRRGTVTTTTTLPTVTTSTTSTSTSTTTTTACAADGSSCVNDGDCCSGSCAAGVCGMTTTTTTTLPSSP